MRLFLTSSGIQDEYKKEFLKFIRKHPKELTVAFIPTAGYVPEEVLSSGPDPVEIKGEETGLIDESRDSLYELGFRVFDLDISIKTAGELKDELVKADIVYVNGGNTFYLMDTINKSGFKDVIKNLDIMYVGVSAGTVVAGIDISIAGWHPNWDKNLIGIKDFSGMGFVDFAISVHFIDSDREVLSANSKNVSYPIIGLCNRQALIVENGKLELAGAHERVIYNANNLLI